jgi:predicted ArsR family transcriptional regulator
MTQAKFCFSTGAQATDTSRAAARHIAPKAAGLREAVLSALERSGPSTADEVAGRLCESILAIRPRLSELNKAGEITDTTARRKNLSGRAAIVWEKKRRREQPRRLNNITNEHQSR